MFNLLPGQGLGFTGSKEIAFGLAPLFVSEEIPSGGGGGGSFRFVDNSYSKKPSDDTEIIELLIPILEVL